MHHDLVLLLTVVVAFALNMILDITCGGAISVRIQTRKRQTMESDPVM